MKTTIKKSELKKIHDVACTDWKSKIEKYAQKNPFEDELTFSEKQIQEMINASNTEQLKVVKAVFDVKDISDSISSVEDACKYLGESDEEVTQLRLLQSLKGIARYIVAEQELVVITKALNEKVEPDWNDSSVYKYYNWWYLGDNFRLCSVNYRDSSSFCSARLCYTTREKAEYSAKKFQSIWKDYLNK